MQKGMTAIRAREDVPSLSLRLQQSQNVVDLDGSLDVSDDGSRAVVHELDSDLGDTSSGTGSSEDLIEQEQ